MIAIKKRSLHIFFTICCLAVLGITACSQRTTTETLPAVEKESFIYAIKGNDTLMLDKYQLPSCRENETAKPIVIFAFGGGFRGGDRASEGYIPYFETLARNGYVVISTDYRAILGRIAMPDHASPIDFMKALQCAIDTAVTDFYDATAFVVTHEKEWRIAPEKIVASGSSAGAITVLQAEYYLSNRLQPASLPQGFHYAGVISFAGAIASRDTLRWENTPCPLMLFHGNADPIVPYEQAFIPTLGGLWGSATIARSLDKIDASRYLYTIDNAGHEIASTPMTRNIDDVLSFLSRYVRQGERLSTDTRETVPGDTTIKKDFTVTEYIANNMR